MKRRRSLSSFHSASPRRVCTRTNSSSGDEGFAVVPPSCTMPDTVVADGAGDCCIASSTSGVAFGTDRSSVGEVSGVPPSSTMSDAVAADGAGDFCSSTSGVSVGTASSAVGLMSVSHLLLLWFLKQFTPLMLMR